MKSSQLRLGGLVLLALAGALYLSMDRGWWLAAQPLTAQGVAAGDQWRAIPDKGTTPRAVVVGHRDQWCQNPGLHVSTQIATADPDSVFSVAQALFQSFRSEAESSPGRYLVVHLEVGSGLHWPWTERPVYLFIWDHTRMGWKCCGHLVPEGVEPPAADRMKRAA